MRNRFPGTCYRCGETVPAGEGHFEKTPFTRFWRVQHTGCAIKFRGTDVGKPGESEKRAEMANRKLFANAKLSGEKGRRARRQLEHTQKGNP